MFICDVLLTFIQSQGASHGEHCHVHLNFTAFIEHKQHTPSTT